MFGKLRRGSGGLESRATRGETEYFSKLFQTSNTEWAEVVCNIQPIIIESQNDELMKEIKTKEVRDALF